MPALPKQAQHDAGETQHRCDGQVDLACDYDQRHRQSHDSYFHDVTGERVLKIKAGQEVRREHSADHSTDQEQEHQQGLPGQQERLDSFHTFFLLEMMARCTPRVIKVSSTTAPIIAAPYSACNQNWETFMMFNAFSNVPSTMAPSMAPRMVPDPPKMLTPPTTTA